MTKEMESIAEDILNKIDINIPHRDDRVYIFRGEPKNFDQISSGLYRCGVAYNKRIEDHRARVKSIEDCVPNLDFLPPGWVADNEKYFAENPTRSLDSQSLRNWQNEQLGECIGFLEQSENGKSILRDVRKLEHPYLNLLSEVQHMGARTMLIDFTWSRYVALYFACMPAMCPVDLESLDHKGPYSEAYGWANGRVIICEVCREDIERIKHANTDGLCKPAECKFYAPDDTTFTRMLALEPSRPESRAKTQESVLVLPDAGYIKPEFFRTVKIPQGWKNIIRGYLAKYHNITDASLYNDIPGYIDYQKKDFYWMKDSSDE